MLPYKMCCKKCIFLFIGSPFTIDVVDSTRCLAKGRGLEASPVNQAASFTIDPSRSHYRADAHVRITCENLLKTSLGNFINSQHIFNRVHTGLYFP